MQLYLMIWVTVLILYRKRFLGQPMQEKCHLNPFPVNVFILYRYKHQKTKVNNKDTRTTPF